MIFVRKSVAIPGRKAGKEGKDVLFNYFFIPPHSINVIPTVPEMTTAIFIF
jgi:hypothetical protein